MSDVLLPEVRSHLMARVRHKGTGPELILRKALWAAGLRYRLNSKKRLPGSPDILFPGARVTVFVDGCFWHGCPEHGTQPKTRPDFWAQKIARNRERDAEVDLKLTEMGWRVVRIWEHRIRFDVAECVADIRHALKPHNSRD